MKRTITIEVDHNGLVIEGDIIWGRVVKNELVRVNDYPTYDASCCNDHTKPGYKVGSYIKSREAVMAVVLGMELPTSIKPT